jgi:hypothetical protein
MSYGRFDYLHLQDLRHGRAGQVFAPGCLLRSLSLPKEKPLMHECKRGFVFWLLDLGSNQGPTD